MTKQRCEWCNDDPLYIAYHDTEWGVPVYEDKKLFEMLILEGMQAGLSWITVLRKREAFRQALANFEPQKVACFTPSKVEKMLQNKNIIRHRGKLNAAVNNAQCFLALQQEYSSASQYLWQFVGGQPLINDWKTFEAIPAQTPESQTLSKALKQRGFKFVGPTICYAFMQAVGMVNDHTRTCFLRH